MTAVQTLAPKALGIAVAAAAIVLGGIAAWRSGPDLAYAPLMAEKAVVLQDGKKIYVQKYEVTVDQWMRCHRDGACALAITLGADEPADSTPATGLSFRDVSKYLAWINAKTGHPFRLPSKTEWRTMALEVLPPKPAPIFTDPSLTWASTYLMGDAPPRSLRTSGSFATTREGVADLNGSVWEWTSDCYNNNENPDQCAAFYVMGEHEAVIPFMVGDPANGGCAAGAPPAHLGMRLVTDLPLPSP